MKIRAVIFGATGMVGEGVLLRSLDSDEVESILVVGRKECGIKHPKLKEIIHYDFYNYESLRANLSGYNACFFCLGVSSIGMKEGDYKKVTYDLTLSAAKILSELNPEMTFCYVSGQGTDSSEKGKLMWARVKGKTENDIARLSFKSTFAFRPGYIKPTIGQRKAYKASEWIAKVYPILRKYFAKYVCTLDDLAMAMINVTKFGYPAKVLENVDITKASKIK